MPNYNKVILMGNLTKDPQLTYLPNNTPVVEFGIATNRKYKRQDGQQVEEVMFIDCRAFAKTAEMVNQYFQKGRPILVEGRLQFDQWTDKEGNKRSKHRVTVENFTFADTKADAQAHGGDGGGGGEPDMGEPRPQRSAPTPQRTPVAAPVSEPAPEIPEDDIPF